MERKEAELVNKRTERVCHVTLSPTHKKKTLILKIYIYQIEKHESFTQLFFIITLHLLMLKKWRLAPLEPN